MQFDGKRLNIQFDISKRVTQRLVSRVMSIFLQEVLGYSDVSIVEKDDEFNVTSAFARLSENSTNSRKSMYVSRYFVLKFKTCIYLQNHTNN